MDDERRTEDGTVRLKQSIRRLWGAVFSLALVTALALGLLAWRQFRTPERIRVENPGGSRAATLTPDNLIITLDGEQRAMLDCHSGVVLHQGDGRFIQMNPQIGILLRESAGSTRCGLTYSSCLIGSESDKKPRKNKDSPNGAPAR